MHAHFLQGIEVYEGNPIFYGLGNFAFPGRRAEARRTVLLKVFLEKGQALRTELSPMMISVEGQPILAKGTEEGKKIMSELNRLCEKFGTSVEGGVLK